MQSLNSMHSSLEISKEMNVEIYGLNFDFIERNYIISKLISNQNINKGLIFSSRNWINVMTINIWLYMFSLSKYLVMPIDDEVSKFGLGINFMVLWQNHGSCVICTLQYNLWYKSKKMMMKTLLRQCLKYKNCVGISI